MTCHASMMLTAVARLTDARLPGALATVPTSAGVPRRLLGLFTVDVEPGRRYPVFIVLVRY
jgi:hypothetical protein